MPIKLAAKPLGFSFDRGFAWSDRIKASINCDRSWADHRERSLLKFA
ncbi:MAG: hypothetical protein ICV80_10935 [Microcoleus sp. T1-bin1]|nr:hypothetical protein [Microcoleus sp. T1-bin1]